MKKLVFLLTTFSLSALLSVNETSCFCFNRRGGNQIDSGGDKEATIEKTYNTDGDPSHNSNIYFENKVYFGTNGNGLWATDNPQAATPIYTNVLMDDDSPSTMSVYAMIDFNTNLYIGTDNGVYYLNPDGKLTDISVDSDRRHIISIFAIYENKLYMGEKNDNYGGVFRMEGDPGSNSWTNLNVETSTGTPIYFINAMYSDDTDGFFVGSNQNGIFKYNSTDDKFDDISTSFKKKVSSITIYKNELYVGTPDEGIFSLVDNEFIKINEDFNHNVVQMINISNSLYIGTTDNGLWEIYNNKLYKYNNTEWKNKSVTWISKYNANILVSSGPSHWGSEAPNQFTGTFLIST